MPKPTYNNAGINPQNNEVISGNEGNEINPQQNQGGDLEARLATLEAKINQLTQQIASLVGEEKKDETGETEQETGLEEARALFPSLNK
jgi:hypothetical protein